MKKFDTLYESISEPQFNRMDGLVNVKDMKSLKQLIKSIATGLKAQGFGDTQKSVIPDYLTHIVKTTIQEVD